MNDAIQIIKLNRILNAAGFGDAEISRGIRMKKTGMAKLAKKLGVDELEANRLLNSLISKLRTSETTNSLEEEYNEAMSEDVRYGFEKDRLGNLTVRDGHTGESVFIRGAEASELINALGVGDTQTILSRYFEDGLTEQAGLEDETYNSEISNDRGSYNFPWVYGSEQGIGTAEYIGAGDTFKVRLVYVMDSSGKEFEPDDKMRHSLMSQAFSFIGDA